ncbi:hypothetical protein CXF83_04260 [Shewanella sp. Choline-02u-19]|uniref:serine hydrolase n=1 Tax=unclassified Shewanella TaxID=196818 RepID=UPI000C33C985|nr:MULTISPECIES: serine hydrolase [unclassified Shewanella]PKH60323.1 hypothetical protein CXF84_02635 [Shewanella sp. Bg11-22]PKI29870.1 hypothetical protein CXF83_04260 [Shewanella sp. Choline-02u-19]
MKTSIKAIVIAVALATTMGAVQAADEVNQATFYSGYDVKDIPAESFQSWPYYTHASMHIKDYLRYGVYEMPASSNPALVTVSHSLDLSTEFKDGQSFRDNLIETNTKGFVVMKNNEILAEHYDNGFKKGMVNNLQSASKTYVGVLLGKAIDAGLVDLDVKAEQYLPELKGSIIGGATIRSIAIMDSGIEALSNYHTPGSNGYEWEKEIGLQNAGEPVGHLKAIKAAKASKFKRGEHWDYTDQNTDTLGLILAEVHGKPFQVLLGDLHEEIGGHDIIEIAKTSDGTTSPSFGINTSAVDYALFAQYIAQGKAGVSFYKELADTSNDVLNQTDAGTMLSAAGAMTYDMQSYTIADKNIIVSFGSFGQLAFSDMTNGITVINQQDWADNVEAEKAVDTIERSVAIIEQLRK